MGELAHQNLRRGRSAAIAAAAVADQAEDLELGDHRSPRRRPSPADLADRRGRARRRRSAENLGVTSAIALSRSAATRPVT
jgi:hypothetical protein